jgi:hypothetical protein
MVSEKVTITATQDGFSVTAACYRSTVELAGLSCRIESIWSDRPLVLRLSPCLDGGATAEKVVAARAADGAVELELQGPFNSQVTLEFLEEGVVVRCTIQDGPAWHCLRALKLEGTFAQVRNFDPDLARFDIPRRITLPIQISSALQTHPKFFQLDWGNYMMPPYLLALHGGGQYVGVGLLEVPDCPIPFDGLVSSGGFELRFDYGETAQQGRYSAVPVGIYLGPNDTDILRHYGESVRFRLGSGGGLAAGERPEWWSGPIYTTWGDQVYRKHYQQGSMTVETASEAFLSAQLVDSALSRLAEEQIFPRTVVLDEGWSVGLGDWQADDAKFGGSLRTYIAAKQQQGWRIVLHFNPFLVAQDGRVAREHPDFLLKDSAVSPKAIHRSGRDYFLFDWSRAECRGKLLEQLAAMLSGDGLNADGIKLSGTKFALPRGSQVSDPSYGRGERYLLAVLRDIHGCVKSVKPDVAVFLNCLNPLLAHYFDIVRAGNTSEVNHDLHVLRAASASWLMGDKPIDTDDWAAYGKVIGMTTFIKVVAGIPNLFSAFFRGDGRVRVGGAAGGHPMQMSAEQYRVVSAAWKIYELFHRAVTDAGCYPGPRNAPGRHGEKLPVAVDRGALNIDYDRMEFSRAGGINSPPFLRTYQGGNVLAAYTGPAIYVASLLEDRCIIDLPMGFDVASIGRIRRGGGSEPVAWRTCLGDRLSFEARSSREDTFYYHIQIRRKKSDGGSL